MCSLCGALSGSSSWTEAARPDDFARVRFQAACLPFAQALMQARGLVVSCWAGHYVVGNGRGRSLVVDDLTACWVAAEQLAGSAVDPLEPDAVRRVQAARA